MHVLTIGVAGHLLLVCDLHLSHLNTEGLIGGFSLDAHLKFLFLLLVSVFLVRIRDQIFVVST